MSSMVDFSSWPREQEQSFIVYEQVSNESSRRAVTAGMFAALVALAVMVGIYVGVAPDQRDVTKDMNMSNITKKRETRETAPAPAAPAPAAPAAPAPAAADPAAAPPAAAPAN